MPTTNALQHHSYGKPEEVLQINTIELPPLAPEEVLIQIEAAPINPADFGRIGGSYGELAPLPATAGLEGVGIVVEKGSQVTQFAIGQRVFIPSATGAWQTHAIAKAADLYPAPENLPIEQAAMAWVNPATAWLLLHTFTKLKPGDWIVQNAATSAVGRLVIQFARHLGFKTLNLVRSLDQAKALTDLGANAVLLDNRDAPKAALEHLGDSKAKLALNSVGGSSALGMCKLLADGSALVTFGGMDREPAPFPTRYLIFNDIQFRGFWVSKWYRDKAKEDILALHRELFAFMENAKVEVPVAASYPLEDWRTALANAQAAGKPGKVLFRM